jgi:hypothetical protein
MIIHDENADLRTGGVFFFHKELSPILASSRVPHGKLKNFKMAPNGRDYPGRR